ncbi:MAG: hypothetical protein WBS20_04750 [Lysobacterales bacterium]
MKKYFFYLALIGLAACGPSAESQNAANTNTEEATKQAVAEAKETVDRTLRGETQATGSEALDGCLVFEDLVPEIFGVDASLVNFRRSIPVRRAGHVLCSASWDKPNKAELDKAYIEAMMEWTKNKARGEKPPKPKPPRGDNRVSLTLVADTFDSNAEAEASLEDAVATLSKGISVEVGGKTHETRTSFGDWIDGIGDKAIFSDKGELMVVSGTRRIAVDVSVTGDDAQDREKAVELAQQVIDTF